MKIIDVSEMMIDGLAIVLDNNWSIYIRYSEVCCEMVSIAEKSIADLEKLIGCEVSDNIMDIMSYEKGMLYLHYGDNEILPLEIQAEDGDCCSSAGSFTLEYVQNITDMVDWNE